jgi:hypothetical protein
MKKELIGIFICMLLIITVFPANGYNLQDSSDNIPHLKVVIESGNGNLSKEGCSGKIWYAGNDNISITVRFNVFFISLKGNMSHLNTSHIYDKRILSPSEILTYHVIPEDFGETFTLVGADLEVFSNGQYQEVVKIGLGIGKFIIFAEIFSIFYNIFFNLLKWLVIQSENI